MNKDVRYILNAEGINPDRVKLVELSPLPDWLEIVNHNYRAQYCHKNVMNLLLELKSVLGGKYQDFDQEIKYVLGYVANEKVHEHAFLKIGNKYYDPTISLEISRTIDTFSLVEVSLTEVETILGRTGMASHGLLMMTLRECSEYADYFTAPSIDDVISEVRKVVEELDVTANAAPR